MLQSNHVRLSAMIALACIGSVPASAGTDQDNAIMVRNDRSPIVSGSGRRTDSDRTLAPFTAIETSDGSDLIITIGSAQSVRVTTDDNLQSHIATVSDAGKLVISAVGSYSTRIRPVVKITMPRLETIALRGSGTARISGLAGGRLTLTGNGSGGFVVDGRLERVAVRINGSGSADLRALDAQDVDVAVNGSGDATMRGSRNIYASVAGSGTIGHLGTAKVVQSVTGSGRIQRLDH